MLFAVGAVSTALQAIKSLTSSAGSSVQSAPGSQSSADPFEVSSPAPSSASSTHATGFVAGQPISPATMNALLAAQGQSSTAAASQSTGPADPVQKNPPQGASSSAASSYHSIQQMIQREANAISFSTDPLSFNA
jgi:hypothetical protein